MKARNKKRYAEKERKERWKRKWYKKGKGLKKEIAKRPSLGTRNIKREGGAVNRT
jgi:hypothetical protein